MRRFGLVGAALLIGVVVMVATAPSSDAATPDWMEPMVEAGRSSLLEHLDLIEPGSPLVLVAAQCREDGAIRLIYENRWLWAVHRQYFTDAPPGWTSGSVGGGILHASDDWLAGHAEVTCADPSAGVAPAHGSRRHTGTEYISGALSGDRSVEPSLARRPALACT